jgi:DNA mismatch endonuclease (patch repair protein)
MAINYSKVLSRVPVANTTPEVALRAMLEARGLFHDSCAKPPAGRPDVALVDHRTAVFVDGCFWHGCPLHYARPRSREEFWSAKLITNLERDARISWKLAEAGWTVVRVWEHEIVNDRNRAADLVEEHMRANSVLLWSTQQRVRRVIEVAESVERRELVLLGEPSVVVEVVEGPRVTAKARARKR